MAAASKPYGPLPLARLASRVLDPATAKRGFAKADLITAWAEVAGPRYAAQTRPEKLVWPRERSAGGAVLTVRAAGSAAIFLQHETEQFIGRVNSFLGYAAVAELRIVQKPITEERPPKRPPPSISAAEEQTIDRTVAGVENDNLREALAALGKAMAKDRLASP